MEFERQPTSELLGPLTEVEEKGTPEFLWVAGDIDLLRNGPRVSVVGSRQVSPEGLARTRRLTAALVDHDMVVVSGLALGVDTAAHTTAIERGGKTIAVLGTPLDQTSTVQNRELQARIMKEHLAVSQFAPGSVVHRANFLARNRTMALVSDATMIVEAGAKSGTQHQAWEALRLGRLLFVLKSVADARLEWVEKVIHYGAQVLTDENLAVALENMPERTRGEEIPF
jgi:DNA processing protein